MTDWNLLFWVIFCPFTHPKNTQKSEFWKKFKSCCRYHLTHVVVIWCMILEIRSETFRSFCHFGPFFAFLTPNSLLPWVLFLVSVNLKCIVWLENYAGMEDWPPPFLASVRNHIRGYVLIQTINSAHSFIVFFDALRLLKIDSIFLLLDVPFCFCSRI